MFHCRVEEGTKRITQNFFKSQTKLKSVHIPNSVQVIEDHAFTGCTSLEAVNFPEGLELICKAAFVQCRSLKSVRLPASVRHMHELAFFNCNSIDALHLRDGLELIGRSAFRACTGIKHLLVPDTVTIIGSYAFAELGIKAIVLPRALKRLLTDGKNRQFLPHRWVNRAFHCCEHLVRVLAPDALVDGTMGCTDRNDPADVFRGCPASMKLVPFSKVKVPRHRFWHDSMHAWCTPATKASVTAVLTVEHRFNTSSPLPHLEPDEHYDGNGLLMFDWRQAHLPHLPHEIWLLILGFIPH